MSGGCAGRRGEAGTHAACRAGRASAAAGAGRGEPRAGEDPGAACVAAAQDRRRSSTSLLGFDQEITNPLLILLGTSEGSPSRWPWRGAQLRAGAGGGAARRRRRSRGPDCARRPLLPGPDARGVSSCPRPRPALRVSVPALRVSRSVTAEPPRSPEGGLVPGLGGAACPPRLKVTNIPPSEKVGTREPPEGELRGHVTRCLWGCGFGGWWSQRREKGRLGLWKRKTDQFMVRGQVDWCKGLGMFIMLLCP